MFIRLFIGAILGFAFASSKQGQALREQIDSLLVQGNEKLEQAKEGLGKAKAKILPCRDGGQNRSGSVGIMGNEESIDQSALDAAKAQELADILGAKPAVPADENLAAFHKDNGDVERKSA